jgi:hypothetical protein
LLALAVTCERDGCRHVLSVKVKLKERYMRREREEEREARPFFKSMAYSRLEAHRIPWQSQHRPGLKESLRTPAAS